MSVTPPDDLGERLARYAPQDVQAELARIDAERARRDMARDIAESVHDPLSYVLRAYPWGQPGGPLADTTGPRAWQREYLAGMRDSLQAAAREQGVTGGGVVSVILREAIASGHGVGKSALVAWLLSWALATRPGTRAVVTANTEQQLKGKTWPELAKWVRMDRIAGPLLRLEATSLHARDVAQEKTWRTDMVPWSEHRSEAFAGLHNKGGRIVLVFDEGSAIVDPIWDVAAGALTDEGTEIIWAVFGNPTRPHGRFRECWGAQAHRWRTRQLDAREVEGTNKTYAAELIEDYGENSDLVRVRVRGVFPNASAMGFVEQAIVSEAQRRPTPPRDRQAPLVIGVDVARGGAARCVLSFRQGLDARTIPAIKIPGSEVRDSMVFAARVAEAIKVFRPDAVFGDATGVGGPALDRVRQLGYNVVDVGFGDRAPDAHCADMRTYMWARLKAALYRGLVLPADDTDLERGLTGAEFGHDKYDRLKLESKEHMSLRGLASPDEADALALTYAYEVAPKLLQPDGSVVSVTGEAGRAQTEYDVLDDEPGGR